VNKSDVSLDIPHIDESKLVVMIILQIYKTYYIPNYLTCNLLGIMPYILLLFNSIQLIINVSYK
jgi:hypothetical protein